eukprot:scaffold7029_cov375-Pinguiococcus_pyrenoidosus.AAC.4
MSLRNRRCLAPNRSRLSESRHLSSRGHSGLSTSCCSCSEAPTACIVEKECQLHLPCAAPSPLSPFFSPVSSFSALPSPFGADAFLSEVSKGASSNLSNLRSLEGKCWDMHQQKASSSSLSLSPVDAERSPQRLQHIPRNIHFYPLRCTSLPWIKMQSAHVGNLCPTDDPCAQRPFPPSQLGVHVLHECLSCSLGPQVGSHVAHHLPQSGDLGIEAASPAFAGEASGAKAAPAGSRQFQCTRKRLLDLQRIIAMARKEVSDLRMQNWEENSAKGSGDSAILRTCRAMWPSLGATPLFSPHGDSRRCLKRRFRLRKVSPQW